jgi:hypothetical protein
MESLTHWFFRMVKCRACGGRHKAIFYLCPWEKRPSDGETASA